MKFVWVILSFLFLAACQPSNDQYDGLTGRVMLYQIDEAQLERVLQTDGIVVIANPNNGWSQQAIPVLNDVAIKQNIRVEYVNGASLRDANSPTTQALVRQIQNAPFLNDYDPVFYDQLYMPLVIKVQGGQIVLAHVGTVSSHRLIQGNIPPLTTEQKAELALLYESFFS
jgi:hypothetical protein